MTPKKEVNGVNVEQLFDTIEAIKKSPDLARCKFRATNKWIGGTHNRATVKDFYWRRSGRCFPGAHGF